MNKKIIISILSFLLTSQLCADTSTREELVTKALTHQKRTEEQYGFSPGDLKSITPYAMTSPKIADLLEDFAINAKLAATNRRNLGKDHRGAAEQVITAATIGRKIREKCYGRPALLETLKELSETTNLDKTYKETKVVNNKVRFGPLVVPSLFIARSLGTAYRNNNEFIKNTLKTTSNKLKYFCSFWFDQARSIATETGPQRTLVIYNGPRERPPTTSTNYDHIFCSLADIISCSSAALAGCFDFESAREGDLLQVLPTIALIHTLFKGGEERTSFYQYRETREAITSIFSLAIMARAYSRSKKAQKEFEESYPLSEENLEPIELHNSRLETKKLKKEAGKKSERYKRIGFNPDAPLEMFNPRTGKMGSLEA